MRFPVIVALAAASLFGFNAHGQGLKAQKEDKEQPLPNEAMVMQVKLKRSQVLLEALTRDDYKLLEENANSLVRISDSTAFLRAYKTEEYEIEARTFRRAAEALGQKAKDKNHDGATLAYLDMTMSCVRCHAYFRGKKRD